jgi:hypothetical protein
LTSASAKELDITLDAAGETWEIRVVIDGVARVDYELTTSMR